MSSALLIHSLSQQQFSMNFTEVISIISVYKVEKLRQRLCLCVHV